jgi:hypothetical protein
MQMLVIVTSNWRQGTAPMAKAAMVKETTDVKNKRQE